MLGVLHGRCTVLAKRSKKVILKDHAAIEKLGFLSLLYENASLEDVAVVAIELLWGKKAEQVKNRLSLLTAELNVEK